MPDAVIMADTGDELPATLRHFDYLEGEITRRTNGQVKVLRVSKGERLSDSIRRRAAGGNGVRRDGTPNRFVSAPFFTENGGQGRRQCTREYKIEPLERMQRELLGYKSRQRIPPGSAEVWIGISTDEVVRAGAAFTRWTVNRYPLLEMRMSRGDCIEWLKRHGYPVPPKSACIFCPYRTNAEWRWLRDNDPDSFADAVEIDRLIRDTPGKKHREFLHADRVPLGDVDLSTAEERGQGSFLNECEGFCGL
ncbi:hypothetical protein [Microbaculum marinisediminis]|nr:hypothetical protein [Microbaculum sp. A6E488]